MRPSTSNTQTGGSEIPEPRIKTKSEGLNPNVRYT
jgi:hypothetical protein